MFVESHGAANGRPDACRLSMNNPTAKITFSSDRVKSAPERRKNMRKIGTLAHAPS
jgi:hypothetical protein